MPATISIMNRHRQSVQRSVRPRRHGFALVVTVSLLVPLTLVALGELSLLPEPVQGPDKIPPGAPQVKVPENVADFYLPVTSDPADGVAPVRMRIIDAGEGKLKAGRMLWLNSTRNLVEGTVGSRKLTIQPGSRVVLDAPAEGLRDHPVGLAFRMPGTATLYPFCETRWRHNPRSRSVVFIFSEEGARTPRMTALADYREPASDEP